jgi:NAD(P)-dependent dehydrogenase (short-subunit alcohol dehydrogenase family)
MELKGIAAIVTGGASGLGAATARALAAAGAKVAVFDLNMDLAAKVAGEVGGIAVRCDVSSAEGAEAAVKEATEKQGIARMLVNCAGVGTPSKAVSKKGPMPLDQFAKVIGINLVGTFNMIRLAAFHMQQAEPLADGERGVIVNTASVAAFDGQIGQPAYAASKGGVHSMTLPLAREFAETGIRVCTIAPGLFWTPMLDGLPEPAKQALVASTLFPKRLGTPEEYASLACYIAQNRMLNGETIRLDGSLRMAPR